MRKISFLIIGAITAFLLPLPASAASEDIVSWTASDKGNFGYVALICHTDEATPRFYGSKMKLPANGSTNIDYDADNSIVWNYDTPYFTYSGPVTCEGRVISKSEKRLVGYTTPRLFHVNVTA